MRFLKRLLLAIVVLLLALAAVAFVLPDKAAAERSIVIDRPASMIYAMLDGYGRFNEWSPWAEKDPKTKYEYAGPARGVGAKMSWSSEQSDVGVGSQSITAVDPGKRVDTLLDFGPMGTANAHLVLSPEGAGTKVTWSFDTELPLKLDGTFLYGLIGRYMGLSMDSMVGTEYERGLAKLKALMESMPSADIAGLEGKVAEHAAQPMYYVSAESAIDAATSGQVLGAAYGEIGQFLAAQKPPIAQTGPVFTQIHAADDKSWKFDAGIPVDRNDVAPAGNVKAGSTCAGKAVEFQHKGPYDGLAAFHARIDAWLAVNAMKANGPRWEIYVSDPTTTAPADILTLVVVPVG
jgi:effector-binding domain-containing protein